MTAAHIIATPGAVAAGIAAGVKVTNKVVDRLADVKIAQVNAQAQVDVARLQAGQGRSE